MIRRRAFTLIVAASLAAGIGVAVSQAGSAKPVCNGVLNNPGCPYKQRVPVFPAREDAPLTRGFIDVSILRKPNRYAKEVYHLVGARPNTTYRVFLIISISDPMCGPGQLGNPIEQPSTYMGTDSKGNRSAKIVAPGPSPENPGGPPPAPAVNNVLNSIRWEWRRSSDGVVDYRTNCIPVFENPPKDQK